MPEDYTKEIELALYAFHIANILTGLEGLDHRKYDINYFVEKLYCVYYYCKESVPLLNLLKWALSRSENES